MLNRSKHEVKMRELLLKIYADPQLARTLMFKGGTACYFFHNLPRFSTDLDFSLIKPIDHNSVLKSLTRISSEVGLIKDNWIKENTIFLLVSHTANSMAIKIEVSTREIETINKHEILPFYGTSINVMLPAHIFANKLLALTTRPSPTARDLYDINFFFEQGWDIDEDVFEVISRVTLDKYLIKLPRFIKTNFNQRNISQGLNNLLETEAQQDFVKKKLTEVVVRNIQIYLDSNYSLKS